MKCSEVQALEDAMGSTVLIIIRGILFIDSGTVHIADGASLNDSDYYTAKRGTHEKNKRYKRRLEQMDTYHSMNYHNQLDDIKEIIRTEK